ncbi:hypothetical protein NC653_000154 [Populus alba x Populus x berolinensis]|uniref:Uncharacterized protein n=1 Tax=Populus alba x Populus x berolinensis TaxID=444605 RepID=A0AAD6RHZ6_9ROSI|nr:hypothetical protein NC653_000154 [Populus alba x Populus x berolinensis]
MVTVYSDLHVRKHAHFCELCKLYKELTNQLIQLERHFNTLELRSFGGNDGSHSDRIALQSRQVPSSLQNTMSSHFAAAEQLSESLSKGSKESPVEQKEVKNELFETIGIPYDASFSSPDATEVSDTSSLKKLLLSPGSTATKGKSRRHRASAMKSCDPETSRRRRDSLDQSRASFEPTNTTVKRVLLQESQKKSVDRSSLLKDSQDVSSVDRSAVHQENRTFPSSFSHPSESKGLQYGFTKRAVEIKPPAAFKLATDPLLPSHPLALRSPALQSNNAMTLSVSSSLVLLTAEDKHTRETYNMNADKSKSMFSHIEEPKSVLINETKSIQQNETNLNKKSAVSTVSPTQTSLFPKKPNEIFVSTYSTALAKSAIESLKHGPANTKGSFFKSASKNHEPPCSSVGATPVAPALPGKVPRINVATSTSQPSEKASSSPAVSISLSVSSSTMINILANIPSSVSTLISSGTMPSSTASTSLSSVSFSPVLPSSISLSFQAPKTVLPSFTPSLTSETSKELQPPLGKNSTF